MKMNSGIWMDWRWNTDDNGSVKLEGNLKIKISQVLANWPYVVITIVTAVGHSDVFIIV